MLYLHVCTGDKDGEAVPMTDENTSEQTSSEDLQEASSNSTGMNECSGERWDTVTDVCS